MLLLKLSLSLCLYMCMYVFVCVSVRLRTKCWAILKSLKWKCRSAFSECFLSFYFILFFLKMQRLYTHTTIPMLNVWFIKINTMSKCPSWTFYHLVRRHYIIWPLVIAAWALWSFLDIITGHISHHCYIWSTIVRVTLCKIALL